MLSKLSPKNWALGFPPPFKLSPAVDYLIENEDDETTATQLHVILAHYQVTSVLLRLHRTDRSLVGSTEDRHTIQNEVAGLARLCIHDNFDNVMWNNDTHSALINACAN